MKNKSESGKTARAKANGDYTSAFTGAANSAMVKAKVKGATAPIQKTPGRAKEGGMPSSVTQALKTFSDYARNSKGGNTAAGYKKNLSKLTSGIAKARVAGATSTVGRKAKIKTSNQGDYNSVNTPTAVRAMKKAGVKNPAYKSTDSRFQTRKRQK